MPIDLYYTAASAPCRSVMMTAKVVGVELNMKPLDLMAGEQMKPEFVAINPQHNVPTLVDGDFVLTESRAICAYLAQQYGKNDSLYPKDPKQRAVCDARMYFDMGSLYQNFGQVYYPIMFGGATSLSEKAKADHATSVGYLDLFLSKSKYVAGDNFTIADIVMMASATTFEATDKTSFEKYPRITSWIETCKADIPDYKEANQEGADMFGQWAAGALAKLA